MYQATVAFWLSIVGTTTAVALAIIRGYEFFSANRIRLKADADLTSSSNVGNTVTILNRSSIPANLHYFDVAWTKRRSLFGWLVPFTGTVIKQDSPIEPPDSYDAVIAPHSTHTLTFTDDDHFDWRESTTGDIYLRVWVIGRNGPAWLWLTGPYREK